MSSAVILVAAASHPFGLLHSEFKSKFWGTPPDPRAWAAPPRPLLPLPIGFPVVAYSQSVCPAQSFKSKFWGTPQTPRMGCAPRVSCCLSLLDCYGRLLAVGQSIGAPGYWCSLCLHARM